MVGRLAPSGATPSRTLRSSLAVAAFAALAAVLGCLLFLSFFTPIANPDLFLHLASARLAEARGLLFLDREAFSFTRTGLPSTNHEWLFDRVAWALYRWGDLRAIAIAQAGMILLLLASMDRFALSRLRREGEPPSPWLRLSLVCLAGSMLVVRASFQPELFSLLFLVCFFFLRDRLMGLLEERRTSRRLWAWGSAWLALFALWANIHTGFIAALLVLALQGAAGLAEAGRAHASGEAQQRSRHLGGAGTLCVLAATAVWATLATPFGWELHRFVAGVLRTTDQASRLIQEWEPARFNNPYLWSFWAVFVLALALAAAETRRLGRVAFELLFLAVGLGAAAAAHIRGTAVFAVVMTPLLAAPAARAASSLTPRFGLAGAALAAFLAAAGLASAAQLGLRARAVAGLMRSGIGPEYVDAAILPVGAARFLESAPETAGAKALTEVGWAGYAAFRFHERGLRVLFHGWSLFTDLFVQTARAMRDPAAFDRFLDAQGVDLVLMRPPDRFFPEADGAKGEPVLRSWHGRAFHPAKWALVWWDDVSFVLVRRSAGKERLKSLEYRLRLPLDPYLIEREVLEGRRKAAEVLAELERNRRETGGGWRNAALARAFSTYRPSPSRRASSR